MSPANWNYQREGPLTTQPTHCPSGWISRLARLSMAALIFEAISGLAITCSPFHPAVQWTVITHTIVGALTLVPLAAYTARHWGQYRTYAPSHVTVLGYVAAMALLLCALSGCIVTGQAVFGIKTAALWR